MKLQETCVTIREGFAGEDENFDKGKIIKKGSVFIDVNRCKNINTQKQTVRQEITQCLGLTNDSYTYPESVFYQGPNSSIEYSPIDRKLIDMLYNHW